MTSLHFIRPWWLLALLPWAVLWISMVRRKPAIDAWRAICDEHLLSHLICSQGQHKRTYVLMLIFTSLFCMILGLSGPAWKKLPVPVYQQKIPHVVLLDMSQDMFLKDLPPSRLARAKFILHDLFHLQDKGQFAMIAYSSVPFVVSPMTDDAQTIDALLPSLTPDVMPVSGYNLDDALQVAKQLLIQSGYQQGALLVLTAHEPQARDIQMVKRLQQEGMTTSVVPMQQVFSDAFLKLVQAGHGNVIALNDVTAGIQQWLHQTSNTQMIDENKKRELSAWRDEGRWFLIPALCLLLPVFRRGWLRELCA